MTKSIQDVLWIRAEWMLRWLSRRRGLLLRSLLCWGIGLLALSVDEPSSYDRRFNLRGDQPAREDVVLLTLYPSDFLRVSDIRTNSLASLKEITDITDSFFWDRETWTKLLSALLQHSPRAVGVTLWFGDNIGDPHLSPAERELFQDRRVFWSTSINNLERMMNPAFARSDLSNIGGSDLRRDDDGIVRRIAPTSGDVPQLVERINRRALPGDQAGQIINFRGNHVFKRYTLSDLLNDEIPTGALTNKIILIGADSGAGSRYLTPVGPLQRAEIQAHILDNDLAGRWIKRLPFFVYALFFGLLTLVAVFLITAYPQSVVLLFFLWISTLFAALSAWSFDVFNFWFPALSPFAQLAATWIIFIGYQATRIERLNFRLQQEQRYLHELEQLKNNFVSLISHDLKTPIAKIQSVVDRLRSLPGDDPELRQDLNSLHDSSEELNRYIQSILKVLRVESRDFKLHREVGDINEVIEQAERQLRPLARVKNIDLTLNLEPMFSAEFDVTLMKEVVLNLIENAIKYTPAGGRVAVRSREIDDLIHVEIADTGQGISPEDRDKVWQKFVRGSGQDHKSKGSGLGLYLVKYFIELHGGQVRLESELGVGSTVSFTLPVTDDTKAEQTEESA